MAKGDVLLESIPEVKKLVELGKSNGEITYDELNDILPDKILNSDKIDDIFILLNQLGIDVVEEPSRRNDAAPLKKEKTHSKKSSSSPSETGVSDDPIRLYLKEIGKVSLLSGDQEVKLAKRIEEGEILIENAVLDSTVLLNELVKNHSKVKSGKIKLTDILRINKLYYFSSFDMHDLEKRYENNMSIIIAEDKKIMQSQAKLKKLSEDSKKALELKEKMMASRSSIREALINLQVHENEINKTAQRILSMVTRIKETRHFFNNLENSFNKTVKELKQFGRKLEKNEDVKKILKELKVKNKDELLEIVKDIRNNERKIRRI